VRRLLYMAHPVRGDIPANAARARRWLRWLYGRFPRDVVIAPWLLELEVVPLADHVEAEREEALLRDQVVVAHCDGIVLVGGRLSHGMAREAAAAAEAGVEITSLLHLGVEPPEGT
jgi:hypothetical protein